MTYAPGSDQSRIFVASHSDFLSLDARDIQTILRERLILVHGNSFDYNYGWNLESFARLHDIDKKVWVHGETAVALLRPPLTKTTFSCHTGSSRAPRTSPTPGNIEAISHHNDLSAQSGLSPPQCNFASIFRKEPLPSLSVRQHGIA